MMTVLEWWGLWGLKVLGMACLSLAVFPMLCYGSCWSKTDSGMWNSGMSDICGRVTSTGWGATKLVGCVMA